VKLERPRSVPTSGEQHRVNKQAAIALGLLAVYTGLDGWTEIFFSFLVQLVATEPFLPGLAFATGVIATAIRREFLGVLAACLLACAYTGVAFGLRNVTWDVVKWAEWTLVRAWIATFLFLVGSVIVLVVRHVTARSRDSTAE